MQLDIDQPLDLAASLESGQAHRWRREGDWFSGVVQGNFIKVRQTRPYSSLGEGGTALPQKGPPQCYPERSEVPTSSSILDRVGRSGVAGQTGAGFAPPQILRRSAPQNDILRQPEGGTQGGARLEFHSEPWPEASVVPLLQSYFRLDDDIQAIYAEISRDARVADMVARYPGLRLLRVEPWECLISFICSANNSIHNIHQNMERLAEGYGSPINLDGQIRHAFPTPAQLAEASETELRALALGFRAPYVAQAIRAVLEGRLDLDALVQMPYSEAKARLMECPGIGPKIADCIAVFSLEKLEAFPIDVWIRRALGEWYFPGQKTPSDRVLLEWAQARFGRYGGYAQQYLFHGRRLEK